uniref:Uncharacterized protein MANES_01G169400 n=1 Tax=Rhizophora mucronata TaxID=61149 RepID=A0A2P2IQ95_RHIMU
MCQRLYLEVWTTPLCITFLLDLPVTIPPL